MSSRKGIVAIVLALAIVLLTAPTGVLGASISEVTHDPAIPKSGEGVDIALKFSDVSNVTSVSIIYCSISPDNKITCEFPQNMIQDSSDNTLFTYTIAKTYDPGIKIGFKFKINYDDGRPNESFPKSQADSPFHDVDGPYEDSYYFIYTLKSESTQDLTLFFIVLAVLIVAFVPLILAALLLMKKRKAKGRNDEEEN
jgi:hypothetical protein